MTTILKILGIASLIMNIILAIMIALQLMGMI